MKKEDLIALGIAEDVADKVLALRGKEITKFQADIDAVKQEAETFKTQLTEANTQIESFKGMKKPEEVDAAVAEWKTKYDQAQEESRNQLAQVKFDHALETALTSAKAKNPKTVTALLNRESLKLKDDGTIEGLDTQLTEIKSKNDYLFEGEKKDPKLVLKSNNQPIQTDAFDAALRKGAGLPEAKE